MASYVPERSAVDNAVMRTSHEGGSSDNATDTSPGSARFAKITMSPALAALPGSALKVCLALACYCSPQKPQAWPKQARLAETLGISEQKVRAWLEAAREAGAVTWTRRPYARATCSYDLSGFWAMAEGTRWPPRATQTKGRRVNQRDASGRFANAQTAGKVGGSKRRKTRRFHPKASHPEETILKREIRIRKTRPRPL